MSSVLMINIKIWISITLQIIHSPFSNNTHKRRSLHVDINFISLAVPNGLSLSDKYRVGITFLSNKTTARDK